MLNASRLDQGNQWFVSVVFIGDHLSLRGNFKIKWRGNILGEHFRVKKNILKYYTVYVFTVYSANVI